jgi:CheY-like chemotaxis protein
MKSKRILLISDDRADADAAREALTALQIPYTLDLADTGDHAIDYLMGRSSSRMENYVRTGKVQPDLVLLSCGIKDMDYQEVLGIMRKYYSLQNIPVLLLCEGDSIIPDTLASSLGAAGFIMRARSEGKTTLESTRMKPLLAGGSSIVGLMPFDWVREATGRVVGVFAKSKAVLAPLGSAVSVKVCSITGGVALCGAVTFNAVDKLGLEGAPGTKVHVEQTVDQNQPETKAPVLITEPTMTDPAPEIMVAEPAPAIGTGETAVTEIKEPAAEAHQTVPAKKVHASPARSANQGAKHVPASAETEDPESNKKVQPGTRTLVIRAIPDDN